MQFYVKQFSSGYELEKFINENKINKENIVKVEYIYKDSIVFFRAFVKRFSSVFLSQTGKIPLFFHFLHFVHE